MNFIVIIFTAQLSLSPFHSEFRVSLGVIALYLLGSFFKEVLTGLFVVACSLGILLTRVVYNSVFYSVISQGSRDLKTAFLISWPEGVFYLFFGFILCIIKQKSENKNMFPVHSALIYFSMDLSSNIVETTIRYGLKAYTLYNLGGLFVVALIRSGIVLIVFLADYSRSRRLLADEYQSRYNHLLLLISRLSSELIWMQKNTVRIEDTMNRSYRLSGLLHDANAGDYFTNEAMSIAKDIHEIKKDYHLMRRGFAEALKGEIEIESMYCSQMLKLLEAPMKNLAEQKGYSLDYLINVSDDFETDQQFEFLSVFRNLFTNAIEAGGTQNNRRHVTIEVDVKRLDDYYIIGVKNRGPEIPKDVQKDIFTPGFSTKINYETGDVSRGLGLSLVKDIVDQHFDGEIRLSSGNGLTVFTIIIHKTELMQSEEI